MAVSQLQGQQSAIEEQLSMLFVFSLIHKSSYIWTAEKDVNAWIIYTQLKYLPK